MATVIDATSRFKESIGYTPLGAPPARLKADAVRAWHDIVAATDTGVLWEIDSIYLSVTATLLAAYRQDKKPSRKRILRKMLNQLLLPRLKISAFLAD